MRVIGCNAATASTVCLLVTVFMGAASDAANAANARRHSAARYEIVARDCTPFNGRYGYYGNFWCDGGGTRVEDADMASRRRTWVKRAKR